PVKLRQKKPRDRFFNYFVAVKDSKVLMNQRGPGDIWRNLYKFPLLESPEARTPDQLRRSAEFSSKFGDETFISRTFGSVKHILSHQKIHTQFIQIENFSEQRGAENGWVYDDFADLERLAQPKLIFEF